MKKANKKIRSLLLIDFLIIAFLCGSLTALTYSYNNPKPTVYEYEEISDKEKISEVAQNYLEASPWSEEGLIEALHKYEHFELSATRSVIENMDVDWQEQAEREVTAYLHMSGNSEKKIREYLRRDLFTDSQIDQAIANIDPDWKEQARKKASSLLSAGYKKESIASELQAQGFESVPGLP